MRFRMDRWRCPSAACPSARRRPCRTRSPPATGRGQQVDALRRHVHDRVHVARNECVVPRGRCRSSPARRAGGLRPGSSPTARRWSGSVRDPRPRLRAGASRQDHAGGRRHPARALHEAGHAPRPPLIRSGSRVRPIVDPPGGRQFERHDMMIEARIDGQGTGVFPEVPVRRDLRSGQLVLAHPHIATPAAACQVVTPENRAPRPEVDALRRWRIGSRGRRPGVRRAAARGAGAGAAHGAGRAGPQLSALAAAGPRLGS